MESDQGIERFPRLTLVEAGVPSSWNFDSDPARAYAQSMTRDVVGQYLELGLDPQFAAILTRHIDDLYLTIDIARQTSCLRVQSRQDEDKAVWYREAVISVDQTNAFRHILASAYTAVTDTKKLADCSNEKIKKLALDWSFFELTADAAAASCYMQLKYDRYIPDYNGQSPHFRSDLAISENYLREYTDMNVPISVLESDHHDFRAGMALLLMHDAILRTNLLPSVAQTRLLMLNLRANYPAIKQNDLSHPIDPLSQTDLVIRLSGMQPRMGVSKAWREFAMTLPDQDEEW